MTLITTCTLLPDTLSSVIATPQYAGRDPSAIHVSDCIRVLTDSLNGGKPSSFEGEDTTRLEIGMAWEGVLERAIALNALSHHPHPDPAAYVRPGPMTVDGITGTPDILDFGSPLPFPVVEEWKCTWMSCRGLREDPSALLTSPKLWKWLVQLKSYCYLHQTYHGRVRALFVNGDYGRGAGGTSPCFLSWELHFSEQDLLDNWAMMKQAAKVVASRRAHP